jgi:ligand-binding SRPBCC domain-containing protein
MADYILEREQWIARPVAEVFEFFSNAANLERITPPWLSFRIVSTAPITVRRGTRIDYEIRWHLFRIKWTSEITDWQLDRSFTDEQVRGPYAFWHHEHTFEAVNGGTQMRDRVHYKTPLGPLGALAHRLRVYSDLNAIFDYRAAEIERIFATN